MRRRPFAPGFDSLDVRFLPTTGPLVPPLPPIDVDAEIETLRDNMNRTQLERQTLDVILDMHRRDRNKRTPTGQPLPDFPPPPVPPPVPYTPSSPIFLPR
jgi:hypothetical protein